MTEPLTSWRSLRAPEAYRVAGVAVTTNLLAAECGPAGFADLAARVVAVAEDPAGLESAACAAAEPWHVLRSGGPATACFRDPGDAVVVAGVRASDDGSATLRWVAPFASALQGEVVLHAGAVAAGGVAHAFVGESGAGKSTLVDALRRTGAALLSDDLLPCRVRDGRIVCPGAGAGADDECWFPLATVSFLARRGGLEDIRWRCAPPREAFIELLRHGFAELPLPRILRLQSRFYERVTAQASAAFLTLPDDRERVDASAEAVRAHLQSAERRDAARPPDRSPRAGG